MNPNHAPGLHRHTPQSGLPLSQAQLPHQQLNYHHQMVDGVGVGGGHEDSGAGMSNNAHLIYANNQQQHLGVGAPVLGDESGACHGSPCPPMPPASWVKQRQHQSHGHPYRGQHADSLLNNNINCSSQQHQSQADVAYGAYSPQQQPIRNSFTKDELQLRQHCAYNNSPADYGNSSNVNSNAMFYSSSQMEHPGGDQSSVSMYYQHQSSASQCQDHNFQQHTGSPDDGSYYGGGNARNYFPDNSQHHYASSQYHSHNHDKLLGQSNCGGGAGVNVNEYGSMSNDRLSYPNNAAGFTSNSCSRMTTSPYDQVHAEFPQQHKPPTQPPFRRNSVDSYSSAAESSDLGYGNKYSSGPSFCVGSGNQFPDQGHNQMKRNNGWSPNVNADDGYLYGEGQTQGQQQRQYSNSANFGPNSSSCRMTPSTPRQHSQNYYPSRSQRHCNSFDERPSTTSSPSGLMGVGGCAATVKAAPVKQRSLSLQYPTPQPTSSIDSNFEPHFNIPDINSHSRSSSASSSSSCRSIGSDSVIDVPVNVNMSPMSSIGSSATSNSGDDSNNSDSYPECSTTTLTLNPGPDSDSVITLHAGDPSDGDNDDNELASCDFDSDFVDIKCEELSEATCSTTTTDCQISESVSSIKCELEEQVNSSVKMTTRSSSSVSVTSTTKSSTGDTPTPTPDAYEKSDLNLKIETTTKHDDEDDHLNNNNRSATGAGGTGFRSKELARVHAANLARFKELLSENSFSTLPLEYSSESSCSLNAVQCPSSSRSTPQKISKRSLSEADKDLVGVPSSPQCSTDRKDISIPVGWARETTVSSSTPTPSSESPSQNYVFYVSPSGTKLRSWDELKHYITSDGTCKCGLNCPLRLERVFSFDPTVSNAHQSDLLDELLNLDEETKSRRFCCSHKRKFPRIEGSPLISSTRDDLGDNGADTGTSDNATTSKKRRTDSVKEGTKANDLSQLTTVTIPAIEQDHGAGLGRSSSGNVSMPFSQQSPDTTTQTPQRDMSPASSISSEPSTSGNGGLLSSSSGNRSSNSTPTPTSKLSPNTTTSDGHSVTSKWGGQYEVSWPSSSQPNSSQSQNNLVTVWPTTTKKVQKISAKRSDSPCPNIDVRQIPPERNRPPPRPRSANATSNEEPPTPAKPPATPDASQGQGQDKDLSILQIQQPGAASANRTVSVEQQISGNSSLQLNTSGYSICPMPLVPNSLPLPGLPLQLANILPLQFPFPRVLPQLNGDTLLIQSAPTTTVQPTPPASAAEDAKSSKDTPSKSDASLSQAEAAPANAPSTSSADSSEKSPLQCVEDVVNRVHTKPLSESLSTNTNGANNSEKGGDQNENKDQPSTGGEASKAAEVSVSTSIVNFLDAAGLSIFSSQAQIPSSIMINTSLAPGATISLSNANGAVTTSSASANMPIMATAPLLNCTTSASGALTLNPQASGSQIILQQPGGAGTATNRYPFFQTVQPFYLNSAGGQNSLIISPQTSDQTNSFIQIDQATGAVSAASAEMLQQAMVLDPSLLGGKKKKKRLSKKQQQQQAQLALQQQLLLQQIQQQVQAQQQVQQNIPQLIFPQSFQLGAPGFSLQPMNYFQPPTILTLPNLILNPADGTLFIQQPTGTPLGAVPTSTSTSTGAMKFSGQYPLQTSPVITQSSAVLAPKKDGSGSAALTPDSVKSGSGSNELSFSSDDSRQNATPDSSTNDLQLGFIGTSNTATTPTTPTAITVSLPLGPASTMMANKKPSKSKAVSSSSSTQKRILPQKQILPKIDSTTPSTENN